jgi:DNA helicase-2/ATP-dependent DNA helicase PcrA
VADLDVILGRELTPEQRRAVEDPSREILALACAGSGKSKTLAFRIARLIAEGADPKGLVAFTFTEKAADSIKLRVSQALGAVGLDPLKLGAMYIGTIHSYCRDVLAQMDARYRQYEVLDENRLKLYLVSRYVELGLGRLRDDRGRPRYFEVIRQVSDAWALLNDEMLDPAALGTQSSAACCPNSVRGSVATNTSTSRSWSASSPRPWSGATGAPSGRSRRSVI